MPLALRRRGGLDIDALRSALCLILERHTVLRTVIVEGEDGLPEGRVLPVPDAGEMLPVLDLSTASDPEGCLLYTSPSPRDNRVSRMPSSA